MGWRTLAQGNASSVPNVQTQTGRRYQLVFSLPRALPDWLQGPVRGAVSTWNSRASVSFAGSQITVSWTA